MVSARIQIARLTQSPSLRTGLATHHRRRRSSNGANVSRRHFWYVRANWMSWITKTQNEADARLPEIAQSTCELI